MAGLHKHKSSTKQISIIENQPPWLLFLIFHYLSAGDLANAMRVCCRWKGVAKDVSLWRRMELRYQSGVNVDSFQRVLRIAPILGKLNCAGLLWTRPVSRALLSTKCKVKSLVVSPSKNQDLVAKLLHKYRETVEDLEVYGLDVSMLDILEVISVMQLKTLTITVPRFVPVSVPYCFKEKPSGQTTLQRLRIIGNGFPVETVRSLINCHRKTLQYLGHDYDDKEIMEAMARCLNLQEVRLRSHSNLYHIDNLKFINVLTLRCSGERVSDGVEPACVQFLRRSPVSKNVDKLTVWCHNFKCCNILHTVAEACSRLRSLSIVKCNLTPDELIESMNLLPNLETLALTYNDYTPPRFLSKWNADVAPGLKTLDLRGTSLCQRERECWAREVTKIRESHPKLIIHWYECEHYRK